MAVNLPQPLFVPGQQKQRSTAEQVLLTLLGQAPDIGFGLANMLQQRDQLGMQDEASQAVLQGLFQTGTLDPSFASAIPGFSYTPPQNAIPIEGNIPGPAGGAIAGGFQGAIPKKGATQLLGTLQSAQTAAASIGASKAQTQATLGGERRAEEMQPYKIAESQAATAASEASTAWNRQQADEAAKFFPGKLAQQKLEAAYTEALTGQALASGAESRARTSLLGREQRQAENEFYLAGYQGDLDSVAALATQIMNTGAIGIPWEEAQRQAIEMYSLPMLPSGKIDKKALRELWVSRARDPNYDESQWITEGQERLRNIAIQSGLSDQDLGWIDSVMATADPNATESQKAKIVIDAAIAEQQPYEVLVQLSRYLSGILGITIDLPKTAQPPVRPKSGSDIGSWGDIGRAAGSGVVNVLRTIGGSGIPGSGGVTR